jgi:hypothetical protein
LRFLKQTIELVKINTNQLEQREEMIMTAPPTTTEEASLATNFASWNPTRTVAYSRKFVAKLTNHSAFPEPWPDWVASLRLISEKSNTLESANLDAESHDKYKVAHKNALNKELKKDLKSCIKHVEMVARGDGNLIRSLGLDMRRARTKSKTPATMLAPVLTVAQGKESRTFSGKAVKCPGAKMTEVQICEGDPTVESNWSRVDLFSTQNFLVEGKVPGRTYSLRARCYGRRGAGNWSAVVTLICL